MKTPKLKKGLIVLSVIVCIFALGYGIKLFTSKQGSGADQGGMMGGMGVGKGRGGVSVRVVPAIAQSTPVLLNALGTVNAANTAIVRARVNGQLWRVHFKEGSYVKEGQLLAELDPRPFQVAVLQAEGAVASSSASLVQARHDLQRYESLLQQESIAPQQVEAQRSQVRQLEGGLKSNQAAVASAKLNLQFSRITAPTSGRVGLRQVDIGNQISTADPNGLVSITQTNPIYVTFALPEVNLSDIWIPFHQGLRLEVQAWSRDNSQWLATGKLDSIDNMVDVTTGTFKLKAIFDNKAAFLFPNQFVNIRIVVKTIEDAIVIPAAAVQVGNKGAFVWRLNKDKSVSFVPVVLGPRFGEQTVVLSGVVAGQQVVTDGVDRLKDGAKVRLVTDVQATPADAKKSSSTIEPSK